MACRVQHNPHLRNPSRRNTVSVLRPLQSLDRGRRGKQNLQVVPLVTSTKSHDLLDKPTLPSITKNDETCSKAPSPCLWCIFPWPRTCPSRQNSQKQDLHQHHPLRRVPSTNRPAYMLHLWPRCCRCACPPKRTTQFAGRSASGRGGGRGVRIWRQFVATPCPPRRHKVPLRQNTS